MIWYSFIYCMIFNKLFQNFYKVGKELLYVDVYLNVCIWYNLFFNKDFCIVKIIFVVYFF